MLFNSLDFILFLGAFLVFWPLMRRENNRRWIFLVCASFVFYGWWDWRFLFLIVFSGLLDFYCGLGMERFSRWRKTFLILSIIGNLGTLGIFKYLDFGIGNVNALMSFFGIDVNLPAAGLMLPIGISFYTFQSMSYTIDIYRGSLKPTRNVAHFFAYLAMFPQLVAGPIVRAKDLLPQLMSASPTTEKQRWEGFRLIIHGFFKKVVIADNLAPIVAMAFNAETPAASSIYWWCIMMMFSFQIYCDFSGYSDIARGLANWMGYEFPVNFNHPYISKSFQEFWTRWHISLSSWFRDYVYIPLGGSRKGKASTHMNIWVTMLLSGFWHGAAWTFIAWGALHAAMLSLEKVSNWPKRILSLPGGKVLAVLFVYALVLIGWVFFRAQSFSQAGEVLTIMFSFQSVDGNIIKELVSYKCVAILLIMICREIYCGLGVDVTDLIDRHTGRVYQPALTGMVLILCIYLRGPGSEFIYFQF